MSKGRVLKGTDQLLGEGSAVAVGQVLLQGQDDAVGDDRQQHRVLERSATELRKWFECVLGLCTNLAFKMTFVPWSMREV